jgi:glycosyltransferase involved in cell wall biosynthesis
MMSQSFNISVVIPVFNAAQFITKAVDSALKQKEVKEILLVEDGSNDNSLEICRQLTQNHTIIRLLQHRDHKNHGASASRNLGLIHAQSEYIAFLDADDFYLPDRFIKDFEIFNKFKDADGVYNAVGTEFISQNETDYKKIHPEMLHTIKKEVEPSVLFPGLLSVIDNFGFISLDGLTIKKSILSKMNQLFLEDLFPGEDTEFLIRVSYYCKLFPGTINVPVTLRTVHDANSIFRNKGKRFEIYFNLWSKLISWVQTGNIESQFIPHIRRVFTCADLTRQPYLSVWLKFIGLIFSDHRYLTKKIYYNNIHYRLFGFGWPGRALLGVKNRIQRVLGISLFLNATNGE